MGFGKGKNMLGYTAIYQRPIKVNLRTATCEPERADLSADPWDDEVWYSDDEFDRRRRLYE